MIVARFYSFSKFFWSRICLSLHYERYKLSNFLKTLVKSIFFYPQNVKTIEFSKLIVKAVCLHLKNSLPNHHHDRSVTANPNRE